MAWKRPEFTELRVGQRVILYRHDDGYSRGATVERVRRNDTDYVIECRFDNGEQTAVYRMLDRWCHGPGATTVGLAGILTNPPENAPEPELLTAPGIGPWESARTDAPGAEEKW